MSDINGPVNPPPAPPASNPTPAGAPPPPVPVRTAATTVKKSGGAATIGAVIAALLLVDLVVETFIAGSPVLLPVAAIAVVSVALLATVWARASGTARVVIPLLGLAGAVVCAAVRLGAGADPALRLATLTLPRLALAVAIVGSVTAAALAGGAVRRAWYLGAVVALVALYALIPLVRGLLAGAALAEVLGGAFDWQVLPTWLQGGYVATEVVLPIGLLAGLASLVLSIVRRGRATWVAAGLVLVAAAFVVQSAELTRAGRSHLLGALTSPLLARASAVALPAGAAPSAPGAASSASTASAPAAGVPPPAAPLASPSAAPGAPPAAAAMGVDNPTQTTTPSQIAPAPAGAVAVAQAGQAIANKAVEVRVTGHRTAASIGRRNADAGREFVVVESSWKNIMPKVKVNRKKAQDRTAGMGSLGFGGGATAKDKAEDEANTTIESVPFEVAPLQKHVWLVADGRYAEAIDIDATNVLEGRMSPAKLSIPQSEQVVSGALAFQAPAGSKSLALLFLDGVNGHLLLPIAGTPPTLASSLGGPGGGNRLVDLAVTGASWSNDPPPAAGMRTLIVGIKGISRGVTMVDVPFRQYAFLQTDQGCLAEPDVKAAGLTRPLAPVGRFIPFVPSEGQLAFTLPAETKAGTLLVRLQQGGPVDLPVMGAAKPAWPSPEATIQDGDVLRVLKLPGTSAPAGLPPGPSGSERVGLDLVVENLRAGAGIDLQTNQQFRLVTPDGKRYEPSRDSGRAPCRLTGPVPAGGARRFTLIYDVPAGQPLQLEYRGFNVKSEVVKVR